MNCRKCARDLPADAIYCCYCGVKQEVTKRAPKRPNGSGWARKRGKTWTAGLIIGYDEKGAANTITIGGFSTKSAALDFVPVLKAAGRIAKAERNSVLRQARICGTIDEALFVVKSYKKKVAADTTTFRELYDRWQPFYEPRIDKSTMSGHRAAMAYFKEIWDIPFSALSADDLQDCIDACPKGRRTRENMKSLGKRLYEYAIGRKLVSINCADYVYIPKETERRRAALSAQQVEMIRQQVGKYPMADYVYCLCYLGFRPNEMLQLEKVSFRQQDGVDFLVGGFKTAAGTDRAVTIAPQIRDILNRRLAAPGDLLFPGPDGERIDDEYFREKVFYPLLAYLGIQAIPKAGEPAELVPYSCRHFFSNLLKDAKGADKDKAALMGHADYETTKRAYQSEDLQAMQRITNSFM